MKSSTNLDANASHGLLPYVKEQMIAAGFDYLNPSSIHSGGQRARIIVEESRHEVSKLLGLTDGERVVFTSGATEANNSVVFCRYLDPKISDAVKKSESFIVTSELEHPSILEPCNKLAELGVGVKFAKPNRAGQIKCDEFYNLVDQDTRLVSLMYANNETGNIFPIAQIAHEISRNYSAALIHTDAVQSVGRIDFDFSELGVDLMSISGHKLGALTGVGALIIRAGLEIEPLLYGGPQEKRSRAGTENVLGIASLGYAARWLSENKVTQISKLKINRDKVKSSLLNNFSDVEFNTHEASIPNTLNVRIPGIKSHDLVVALDLVGVCLSSGAACASGKPGASHVLLAMGLDQEQASESIRISVKADYEPEELEHAIDKLVTCITRMKDVR
ncbi:MAG: cysteine desulfurase [Deltaproteobacteria bacterium]|nr:cysteine desulfurase [Deltaproteobacteria bacterium]